MEQRKILHISDLHIDEAGGSILQKENYVITLIESLKNQKGLDTMVISGDIVNQGGSKRAYEEAERILNTIKKELNISHILCVPGNHDVNRDFLRAKEKKLSNLNEKDELWKDYGTKFELYWEFLKRMEIYQDRLCGLVMYKELKDPNIILLGLDSTDQIGIDDHCGYINEESLAASLKNLLENTDKYKGYVKLAILHHRPIVYESRVQTYTERGTIVGQYGTCDLENWERIKKILLKYDVHYVLTGHVHGTQSEQIRTFESEDDAINYSTVGSIGVDFSKDIKELLRKDLSQNQHLIKKFEELKCYESISGNHNAYNLWTFSSNGLIKEEQFKYIVDEGKGRWLHWSEKIFNKEKQKDAREGFFSVMPQKLPNNPDNTDELEIYRKELLKCIRENKLYKTGHFHWKNTARLNWIDTSYFFCHRDKMNTIVKGIDILFREKEKLKDVDCIIGLGIKGSIMLSYVRFLFPEKICSYYPENKNEYNDYELNLFEKGYNGVEINSIAVLTDVVHSGDTVHTFIKEVHEKIKHYVVFNVVTIVDTTTDGNIAEVEGASEIHLFPIIRIKVFDCQGGRESCKIYTEKLAYIYEYKEDQNESK